MRCPVFGLGAGAYYVGRSHPDVLIDLFSAWALAVSFLFVVVVRAIASRSSRWPMPAEALVLVGFGLMVCSLAQTPTPWSQAERLGRATPRPLLAAERRTIDHLTRQGESVALLLDQGHRIAAELGVDDVTPYAFNDAMTKREQWEEMLAALRASHGRLVVLPTHQVSQDQVDWLQRQGFLSVYQDRWVIALAPRTSGGAAAR